MNFSVVEFLDVWLMDLNVLNTYSRPTLVGGLMDLNVLVYEIV